MSFDRLIEKIEEEKLRKEFVSPDYEKKVIEPLFSSVEKLEWMDNPEKKKKDIWTKVDANVRGSIEGAVFGKGPNGLGWYDANGKLIKPWPPSNL